MSLTRVQIAIGGAVLAVVLFFVLLFLRVIPGLRDSGSNTQLPTIEVWGVFEDSQVLGELKSLVPFRFRNFDPATYEADLVNALAAGTGPDVFMIHNTWLPKHFDKLSPIPEKLLPYASFQNIFPEVVRQDFAPNAAVYALPLYIDTLGMLYNKDIFDAKGIALPPKTWSDFSALIPSLRELDRQGRVVKAAAAIGGSAKSINRATDLLNALMLQSGVAMVSDDFGRATFADRGKQAFSFYLSFANPANTAFTWSEDFPYSIDSFADESTAVIFNYSYQRAALKQKNPFLRVGVAPLPQPSAASRPVTFANYWGFAVSARSTHKDAAARFVVDLATDQARAKKYFDLTERPSALLTLIDTELNLPDVGVFARQALTARSWPQIDNALVERAFSEAIASVLAVRLTPEEALANAENQISEAMERRKSSQ